MTRAGTVMLGGMTLGYRETGVPDQLTRGVVARHGRGLARVDLIGHSLGGFVAMFLTARDPARVR